MADIDDELLALAGDASSDEEEAPNDLSREDSALPEHSSSGKHIGKKSSDRKSKKRDDSEEEGEA